jgi:hypothetical protein
LIRSQDIPSEQMDEPESNHRQDKDQEVIEIASAKSISDTTASFCPSDDDFEPPKKTPLKRRFDEISSDRPSAADKRKPAQETALTCDIRSPTVSALTHSSPAVVPRIQLVAPETPASRTKSTQLANNPSDAISSKLEILSDVVFWLLSKVQEKEGNTPELVDRMKLIRATVAREPSAAFGRLTEDLVAADELLHQSRNMNRDLFGTQNLLQKPTVLPVPSPGALDREWKLMRRNVHVAVGNDLAPVAISPLAVDSLADRIEELFQTKEPSPTLQNLVAGLEGYLQGPHAVQCFLSALLCRMVFKSPEPMCRDQHPIQTMRYYDLLRQTGESIGSEYRRLTKVSSDGIPAVKHHDVIATQLLLTDVKFRQTTVKKREQVMHGTFWKAVKLVCPSAGGFEARGRPRIYHSKRKMQAQEDSDLPVSGSC